MKIAVVTGAAGLVGTEAVRFFRERFDLVIGLDNGMRGALFGEGGDVSGNVAEMSFIPNYRHHDVDIRDYSLVAQVLATYGTDVELIVHTAGQPSHDWATERTLDDFWINAVGTLNMLEGARRHCPDATFVVTSTNKVYGDKPNTLPLVELDTRWDIHPDHPYHHSGIDESMELDNTDRTFFGVSKLSADLAAQEYGRHLGMKVGVFRCSNITGPRHAGVPLHGFLSHLVRTAVAGNEYTILGHGGKQVRDNIDARDLVRMFWHYHLEPRPGAVYHAGGGRERSTSILEAIARCEQLTGRPMAVRYEPHARFTDAKCWITDTRKFRRHYPGWEPRHGLDDTLASMHAHWSSFAAAPASAAPTSTEIEQERV
ncbi:NAD-dependent epimerase/dehydratase family protein [Saccharothrix syringae]|uniref:NAD-dependent epimerase/dehydratase family protein n=2 Tax=Saccharothrix syringae TaxID=103733 RepID=A0A5Q0GYX0_SACSY|nr:NAD-dependent epimerase/dehydratase family protein [Saccharothrix syringae]QFZ18572.1 NAD-dependent epimerase/dehydratase family protein [Saccharothrix syringae]